MAEELIPNNAFQGYFTQQNLIILLFWVVFILGMIIILVSIGFGIWYLTYRIKVRYYQVIGVNQEDKEILRFIGTDKAKLVKFRGGIYNLRFFWKRRKIEPPPTEAYLSTRKGYEMHVKTNGIDYNPMVMTANPGFAEVPMHKRLWLIQTQKQAIDQYSKPTFWEKYGNLIVAFSTILLCLAAMSFTIWFAYKLGSQAVTAGASNVAKSIEASKVIVPGA